MVPKYFFIVVFIVIGSTLVVSQSGCSCSIKQVNGKFPGKWYCKYFCLKFFFSFNLFTTVKELLIN